MAHFENFKCLIYKSAPDILLMVAHDLWPKTKNFISCQIIMYFGFNFEFFNQNINYQRMQKQTCYCSK